MDKHRKIDSQDLINPDFATSTYYGGHSLTEDELLSRLRSDYTIYRKFAKYGYIISKEFSFITCATFDEMKISELDYKYHGAKTPAQKSQATKMCKIVEDYFNSFDTKKSIQVVFISRSDSECALYDGSRFDYNEINKKLIEVFA
ncbi:hypothetical protein AALA36_19710 [Lachnospiraceae bacterium 66-29]|jgi:hypothetical protein